MALLKDRAIILSTRVFGESDKIVRFFTLNSGKLTGIAKGGKKSQKRFMNTLELFNVVNLEYFEKAGAGMVRIDSADLVETNMDIGSSLQGHVHRELLYGVRRQAHKGEGEERRPFSTFEREPRQA